jgi:hypothetical protein
MSISPVHISGRTKVDQPLIWTLTLFAIAGHCVA